MKRAICLMTVLGGALLGGCGGGGDSTPETPTTPTVQTPAKLSKADFIKKADGYCAELNAALGALSTGGPASSAASIARDIAYAYEGLLNSLRGLGTPDDQTGLDEVLSAGEDIVSAEESVEHAATNGDDAALASAKSEVASAKSRFASAASAYGFNQCGQGATTP
jgi:hypothetical protein